MDQTKFIDAFTNRLGTLGRMASKWTESPWNGANFVEGAPSAISNANQAPYIIIVYWYYRCTIKRGTSVEVLFVFYYSKGTWKFKTGAFVSWQLQYRQLTISRGINLTFSWALHSLNRLIVKAELLFLKRRAIKFCARGKRRSSRPPPFGTALNKTTIIWEILFLYFF